MYVIAIAISVALAIQETPIRIVNDSYVWWKTRITDGKHASLVIAISVGGNTQPYIRICLCGNMITTMQRKHDSKIPDRGGTRITMTPVNLKAN